MCYSILTTVLLDTTAQHRDRFLVDAKLYLGDLAVDLVERGIYGHGESFLVLQ